MTTDELLDTKSAARYLRVGRSTLFRRISAGTAPRSVKTGPLQQSRRYFPRAALDLWLVEHSGPAARR